MELTEHIALYLKTHGFPETLCADLPAAPDEAAAVIATDLRPAADRAGSRFQILVRSAPGEDNALTASSRIMLLLSGFCGMLDPDSPLILRIQVEGGAAKVETDAHGRIIYSINFRAWHC